MARNLNSICGFCHLVLLWHVLAFHTGTPMCCGCWIETATKSVHPSHTQAFNWCPTWNTGLINHRRTHSKDRHETVHPMWSSLITKEEQQAQKILYQWPFCPQSQHTCIVPSKIQTTHSPRSVPVVSSLLSWPLNQWCRTLFFSGENLCGLNVPSVKQGNRRTQNCLPALPEKKKWKWSTYYTIHTKGIPQSPKDITDKITS